MLGRARKLSRVATATGGRGRERPTTDPLTSRALLRRVTGAIAALFAGCTSRDSVGPATSREFPCRRAGLREDQNRVPPFSAPARDEMQRVRAVFVDLRAARIGLAGQERHLPDHGIQRAAHIAACVDVHSCRRPRRRPAGSSQSRQNDRYRSRTAISVHSSRRARVVVMLFAARRAGPRLPAPSAKRRRV